METVTVTATRLFSMSEVELFLGSAVAIAAVAWVLLSKVKHLRLPEEHSQG